MERFYIEFNVLKVILSKNNSLLSDNRYDELVEKILMLRCLKTKKESRDYWLQKSNTALFGFLNICDPKPGETVVISAAAGAVGIHVGQIAKNLGCYVIGFAGSDHKVKYLKEVLKFDAVFNYKTKDINAALLEAAPHGVDCYFDNVGGDFSSAVIYRMKNFGRVSVCGSISSYNTNPKNLPKVSMLQPAIVFKQLKIEGFIVSRWADKWQSGIERNLNFIKEGKLIYPEYIVQGFESLPHAFIGMLNGENIGKALVKV